MKVKKVYYLLKLKQISPLRIGNGKHVESDNDLMVDGRGLPFIPGSSLAGVFRHYAVNLGMDAKTERHLFGIISMNEEDSETENISSAILFSDATLSNKETEENIFIGRRDGVGLNEWGTVKKMSKFDFQMVETSQEYQAMIEWEGTEEQYEDEISEIVEPTLQHFIVAGMKVGARTTRGYGNMALTVFKKSFSFPEQLEDWILFCPYEKTSFCDAIQLEGIYGNKENILEIDFQMVSPFSVSVNTTKTEPEEDGSLPDSIPMENINGNPVIPGTAWAGVFRHHMHAMMRDLGIQEYSDEVKKLDTIFGKEETGHKKSKITFSETEIAVTKQQRESVVRTAIDRFSATPINSSLRTDAVYVGGKGTLRICLEQDEMEQMYQELLAATICDLDMGMVTIGGKAAIGQGIIKVSGLRHNGKDIIDKMKASMEKGASLSWLKGGIKNA